VARLIDDGAAILAKSWCLTLGVFGRYSRVPSTEPYCNTGGTFLVVIDRLVY
jgi:hypothetical protein